MEQRQYRLQHEPQDDVGVGVGGLVLQLDLGGFHIPVREIRPEERVQGIAGVGQVVRPRVFGGVRGFRRGAGLAVVVFVVEDALALDPGRPQLVQDGAVERGQGLGV